MLYAINTFRKGLNVCFFLLGIIDESLVISMYHPLPLKTMKFKFGSQSIVGASSLVAVKFNNYFEGFWQLVQVGV